jgi:hypothetical protein
MIYHYHSDFPHDQLRADLTRHNVEVKVQEDFKDYGIPTVENDDVYIKACDAVASLATAQSFARSTYDPSSVEITIRVPAATWGGTVVRTPLSSIAGL